MESQQTWRGDNGVINLWERVGIVYLGDAPRHGLDLPLRELNFETGASDPPISLEDYLIEHQMKADAASIDELTVRQALMTLGLAERAHQYPEWVCAEAWLFVALRIGQRVAAVEILARAHDLGLSQSSIEQARVRLGVVMTRRPDAKQGGERWQLPPSLTTHGTPADVDPRWRRFLEGA